MKRFGILLILALVISLGASAAFSQGWTPGPPMGMPDAGGPMPGMGQACPPPMPMPMPMPDASCAPMPPMCAPPMPCGPPRSASFGVIVGYQVDSDSGCIKMSTRGNNLLQQTGVKIKFNLQGVVLGVSGRGQLGDCGWGRMEYRHLFSTVDKVSDLVTSLNIGTPGERDFNKARYHNDLLDWSAGYTLCPGISVLGGFRWDHMYLFLGNPRTIPLFSSPEDEGGLTINSYVPYGGVELAWAGCDSGAMLKVIGTPWQSTSTKFGLTFGPGGAENRGPIRDYLSATSKWGSLIEATLSAGKKIGGNLTIGAFGMLSNINAHSEKSMSATRQVGSDPIATLPEYTANSPFDIDMNRFTVTVGGNAAVSFNAPF